MLKISESTESTTQPGEGIVGIGGDTRARYNRNKLDGSEIDESEIDSNEVNGSKVDYKIRKKNQKTSKFKYLFKSKKSFKSKKTFGLDFFISRARLAFIKLRQIFIKTLILYHFDPERYIRVQTDVLGYAIIEVLSQLTLDNLGRWYLVAFFSQKMILAETRYKTRNCKLLAIVQV